MLRNLIISAAGAGVAVCLAVSALQAVTTEPLILHAELFENAGVVEPAAAEIAVAPAAAEIVVHEHAAATPAHPHDAEAWAPADGLQRTAYTALANLVVGAAVALMLLGLMALLGQPIDARRGLMFGAAGFVAASFLPSLGLPPELPGTPAGDILLRQGWWIATAVASAVALGLLAFARPWPWKIAALALLVVPHVIGAPEPPSLEAAYPAAMAGEFVIASMVVSALLWVLAGLSAGWLHTRLARLA